MPSLSVILCSAFVRPIILSSLVITWKCPSTAIHISYRGCAIHTLFVELQCHTLLPQLRASLLQSSIFFWFVLPDKHADKNDCAQRSDERPRILHLVASTDAYTQRFLQLLTYIISPHYHTVSLSVSRRRIKCGKYLINLRLLIYTTLCLARFLRTI